MKPAQSISSEDCLRAATASILNMHPRRVPHFIRRRGYWLVVWSDWLAARGVSLRRVDFKRLADAPRGYWIAIVDNDGEWSHAVVMRGSRVVHDSSSYRPRRHRYFCGYVLDPLP